MQVALGASMLMINHGNTFMASDLSGQINPHTRHGGVSSHMGIFSNDTRFLSHYACYINGKSWIALTCSQTRYYAARVYLTNPEFSSVNGKVPQGDLSLTLSRTIEQGVHEDIHITNHSLNSVSFKLQISLYSDFADIFEVDSQAFNQREQIKTRWCEEKKQLENSYQNHNFYRSLIYQPGNFSSSPYYSNGYVTFEVFLVAGATWHTCGKYNLVDYQQIRQAVDFCYETMVNCQTIKTQIQRFYCEWHQSVTEILAADENLQKLYCQSVEDIGSLRLYQDDVNSEAWLCAAGVPKLATLFGRDSLIISLQSMMVCPRYSRGILQKLGQLQATQLDNWRDAQPGKIIHEIRQGELTYFNQIPYTPYYGTADATALFLITLHETWQWLGDDSLLADNREIARQCLHWIDNYGDLDGDGFQEYQTKSLMGKKNQGWKDSQTAIVYPDGSQVKAPKALCELQGYVFDAWMRMGEVFDVLGEGSFAQELRAKADKLQVSFAEKFWSDELACYVLSLDDNKQQVRSLASNAGHCLWSGIASFEHAAKIVNRLMEPDMWSGWGIRTLSSQHPAYNPYSYHLGSVWPHDNGIIALGFKRYGFTEEVNKLVEGVCDATKYFANYHLPQFYAGVKRELGAFPASPVAANVPQGCAAASVFHLIQAMLGIRADAPHGFLYVDPRLPKWLPELELKNLQVGNACLNLQFWRNREVTQWDAMLTSGDIDVIQQPW